MEEEEEEVQPGDRPLVALRPDLLISQRLARRRWQLRLQLTVGML